MNKRGFTLIEILVVISIIGLISSVALANFQDAKQKAKQAAGRQFQATIYRSLSDELVAEWDFVGVENTPVTPEDGSGLVNPGDNEPTSQLSNVLYVNDELVGSAVAFDGSSSYIAGQNFPDLGTNSDVTVSAWVKPTDVLSENTIFFKGNGSSSCNGFQVGIKGGRGFVNGTIETTSYAVSNNTWQNLTFVYNRGTDGADGSVDTYINGVKISTTPNAQTTSCPNDEWSIGAKLSYLAGGNFVNSVSSAFAGQIESVYIYKSAFTASEVGQIYATSRRGRTALADF